MGRFPSLETAALTCPACGATVDLPVTVTPVPVGAETDRALFTMPPVVHRCEPT